MGHKSMPVLVAALAAHAEQTDRIDEEDVAAA